MGYPFFCFRRLGVILFAYFGGDGNTTKDIGSKRVGCQEETEGHRMRVAIISPYVCRVQRISTSSSWPEEPPGWDGPHAMAHLFHVPAQGNYEAEPRDIRGAIMRLPAFQECAEGSGVRMMTPGTGFDL